VAMSVWVELDPAVVYVQLSPARTDLFLSPISRRHLKPAKHQGETTSARFWIEFRGFLSWLDGHRQAFGLYG